MSSGLDRLPGSAGGAIERPPVLSRTRLKRRHAAERRFRFYSIAAVGVAASLLALLVTTIAVRARAGFRQTFVNLDFVIDPALVDPSGARRADDLAKGNYLAVVKQALRSRFPDVTERSDLVDLYRLVSPAAADAVRAEVASDPSLVGGTITIRVAATDDVDALVKGLVDRETPATERKITDNQIRWVDALEKDGRITLGFSRSLFTNGDSREPEMAGLLAALTGSAMTLLVTFALSFPLGVLAAVYLEEFALRNRWTSLIEVNINNLAAVPSVIFGLLGLAVLLNVFGLPRSSPFVGGVVLALMTLPTLIIAARAAISAVPASIREAALAVGASDVQVVLHHVVPLAMPGILTGGIIGMARALGETAPLLMVGMVAFVVDVPKSVVDAATVLPVQIFIWADSPERGFVARTAAATIVLLLFLVAMNASAVLLRRRFEKRW